MASIGMESKGVEGLSVYHATKAAIRSFARSWSVDLKQRKIRVNSISAGPIDTPGLRHAGCAKCREINDDLFERHTSREIWHA